VPSVEILNIFDSGFANILSRGLQALVATIISEITIKGKSEGISLLTDNSIPFRTPSAQSSEYLRPRAIANTEHISKRICLLVIPLVIYSLPRS
jgi:hypothetical protein